MSMRPLLLFVAAACLATTLSPARAAPQEEPPVGEEAAPPQEPRDPEADIRKTRKARRLLESSGWLEQTKAGILDNLRAKETSGLLPAGTAEKFDSMADWKGLFDSAVASYVKNLDEHVMDAAIVFYESPEGQEFAETQPEMAKAAALATRDFVAETTTKAMAAAGTGDLAEKAGGLLDAMKDRKIAANESALLTRLRTVVAAQAMFGAKGYCDRDANGTGEYGTLGELTGMVGVRAADDFSAHGEMVDAALLSPDMAPIDADGVLVAKGYCLRILLPARGGGFVHETGPIEEKKSLLGKSTFTVKAYGVAGGAIDPGAAESQWCAYAWPETRGETGNRAFFVNQDGDILECANGDDLGWSGPAAPPPHDAAFREAGGPGKPIAVDAEGRAGTWTVVN